MTAIKPLGRTAELTEDVNPVAEIYQRIAALDSQIATLLIRKNSNDQFGDRRFKSLNSLRYRSQIDQVGMQRESAIKELESFGVMYARKVQLKEAPMPPVLHRYRVVTDPHWGFVTTYWGREGVGCYHEVSASEDSEARAIEEHKEKCL